MAMWTMAPSTVMRAPVPAVTRGRPAEARNEQAADRDGDGAAERAGVDADNSNVSSVVDEAVGVAGDGTDDARGGAAGDSSGESAAQVSTRASVSARTWATVWTTAGNNSVGGGADHNAEDRDE